MAILKNDIMRNSSTNAGSSRMSGGAMEAENRAVFREEVRELMERDKRKESVIVRGISCAGEREFREKFAQVTGAVIGRSINPDSFFCIDQSKNLYRISILDSNLRKNLLDNAKNLKNNSDFRNVYLNRDLTFKQRQDLKTRRENLTRTVTPNGDSSLNV